MATPRTVTQYADDEHNQIQWESDYLKFLTSPGTSSTTTVKPLRHIARAPKYDIVDVTWSIMLTNFNFDNLPASISNITLNTTMNRYGRITDDIIQLCYQGQLIGSNQSQPVEDSHGRSLLNSHTNYNGDLKQWGVTDLTTMMVQDPSFGIVVRYKGHPAWPHRTAPILYAVGLQID